MKNPDKKNPDVLYVTTWSVFFLIFAGLPMLIIGAKLSELQIHLNYALMLWVSGIGFVGLYSIIFYLTYIAMTYVWEYRALVKYLRARGLENFIQEAKKIRKL